MATDRKLPASDLERREIHLSIFACSAIVVLAGGIALLMYPAVFAIRDESLAPVPEVAFFGFCALACFLVAYIVDRQITIRRLRAQMAVDRKRSSEALRQASADLLSTMPNFNTFEDRLDDGVPARGCRGAEAFGAGDLHQAESRLFRAKPWRCLRLAMRPRPSRGSCASRIPCSF